MKLFKFILLGLCSLAFLLVVNSNLRETRSLENSVDVEFDELAVC